MQRPPPDGVVRNDQNTKTGFTNRIILLASLGGIIPAMFTEIELKQPIRGFELKRESKTDDVARSSSLYIHRKHITIYIQCQ